VLLVLRVLWHRVLLPVVSPIHCPLPEEGARKAGPLCSEQLLRLWVERGIRCYLSFGLSREVVVGILDKASNVGIILTIDLTALTLGVPFGTLTIASQPGNS
jgi:hypothetical protein